MDFETESRNRIIRLEQKVDFLLKELNLTEKEAQNAAKANSDDPILVEALALLRQGKTVQAIGVYARKKGIGVKEAKEVIDRYM
ncbi:MAG TPA: hypothetical protein VGD98_08165 [Ktedonobacteraceae bacterium]